MASAQQLQPNEVKDKVRSIKLTSISVWTTYLLTEYYVWRLDTRAYYEKRDIHFRMQI